MKIVFAIWLAGVTALSVLLYRATYFEYAIVEGVLEVKLIWAGILRVPKHVPLSDIQSVSKLRSLREIVPLVNGTFPSLWGKFRPNSMIIVTFKRCQRFPLVITPDNPEDILNRLSQLTSRGTN